MPKKDDNLKPKKLDQIPPESFLSTGFDEVDEILGGGFPRKRITQVWGNPGTGKSYLMAHCLANLDGKALYIDSEFALNKQRLIDIGVDLTKFDYIASSELEKVAEYVIENVHKYDLVIIDTLAKLTPTVVQRNEVGENAIGLVARQIAHFEAKLRPRLHISDTAVVGINQVRANFNMGPVTTQAFGGWAWGHTLDLNLRFFKGANNKIYKQSNGVKREVGHWVSVKVEKSKVSTPFSETKFKLSYEKEQSDGDK